MVLFAIAAQISLISSAQAQDMKGMDMSKKDNKQQETYLPNAPRNTFQKPWQLPQMWYEVGSRKKQTSNNPSTRCNASVKRYS